LLEARKFNYNLQSKILREIYLSTLFKIPFLETSLNSSNIIPSYIFKKIMYGISKKKWIKFNIKHINEVLDIFLTAI
jgi:hypothetical protein